MAPAGSCVQAAASHERMAIKNDQRNYCTWLHNISHAWLGAHPSALTRAEACTHIHMHKLISIFF